MPHKCVKCDSVYEEDLPPVEQGCSCGSKVFLFVRKERFEKLQHVDDNGGKYDIDLPGLFGVKKPKIGAVQYADGKYNIDLQGALSKNL